MNAETEMKKVPCPWGDSIKEVDMVLTPLLARLGSIHVLPTSNNVATKKALQIVSKARNNLVCAAAGGTAPMETWEYLKSASLTDMYVNVGRIRGVSSKVDSLCRNAADNISLILSEASDAKQAFEPLSDEHVEYVLHRIFVRILKLADAFEAWFHKNSWKGKIK